MPHRWALIFPAVSLCLLGCTSGEPGTVGERTQSPTPTSSAASTPSTDSTTREADVLAAAVAEVLNRELVVTEITLLVDGVPKRTHRTTWEARKDNFLTDLQFIGAGERGHFQVLRVGGVGYIVSMVTGPVPGCWIRVPDLAEQDFGQLVGRPLDSLEWLEPDAIRLPGGMRFLSDKEFNLYVDGQTGEGTVPAAVSLVGGSLAGFTISGADVAERLRDPSKVPPKDNALLADATWVVTFPEDVDPEPPTPPPYYAAVAEGAVGMGVSCDHPISE